MVGNLNPKDLKEKENPIVEENNSNKYKKFRENYLDKSKLPPGRYSIIEMIEKMILHFINEFSIKIKIPDQIYFKCNRCGNCCKNSRYKIPITILDCANWIKSDRKFILKALDHNKGHPKNLLFFITKKNFKDYMIENYGKKIYDYYIKINQSLNQINLENEEDCVFFNSNNYECSIYKYRPLHCQLYPYFSLLKLNLIKIYSKGYKKVSKMRLKDNHYKAFLKNGDFLVLKCSSEIINQNITNLKKIKKSNLVQKIKKFVIADLFSGSLYFKNRKDILELIYYSLFSKKYPFEN